MRGENQTPKLVPEIRGDKQGCDFGTYLYMMQQNMCRLYLQRRDLCLDCRRIKYFINDNEHVYKGEDS